MSAKYNYEAGLELLVRAHKENTIVTYEQMEKALGLEKPLTDKSAQSANAGAIYELRKRFREQNGLVFKSAAGGTNSGPEYQHYTIESIATIKGESIKPVKTETSTSVVENNKALNALEKDNQKLFLEKEGLSNKITSLQKELDCLKEKEIKYKTIIHSLMGLAGV